MMLKIAQKFLKNLPEKEGKMDKRIYIKVDDLQLKGLKKESPESKRAWGAFNVGKNGFKIESVLFTLGEKDQLTQNYTSAHMRLLDTPIEHKVNQKNSRQVMLSSELIEKAVYDEYLIRRKNELTAFIQKSKAGEIMDFPSFQPPDWKKPLHIPVDFIELSYFYRQESGEIFSHAQIGHHLLFYDIQIWDPKGFGCQTQEIKDRRILYAINDLLRKRKVKKFLESLITIDHTVAFIDKVPGCNPKAPPPPVKFY